MAKKSKAIAPTEIVKSEVKNVGGRPRKSIDEAKLRRMAESIMTVEQIADALDCSADVLYDRYGDVLREGRGNRKTSLSQSMWKNAIDKENVQMQIWLAKQHLGHKDSQPETAQQVNFNVIVNEVPK